MENWVRLQNMLGYGFAGVMKIVSSIDSPDYILNMDDKQLASVGFKPEQINRKNAMSHKDAAKIVNVCKENGISIIPITDKRYPSRLRDIDSPPLVLYVMGEMPRFDDIASVAIVGPRKVTDYGRQAAFSLAARLTLGGALVVSGGALGADSFAHNGAMAAGGKTVAVTGGGLLSTYLKSNKPLRDSILNNGGTLLTEFMPDYVPRRGDSFHLRNRVLSGLCCAVAVIEAGSKSGTLITAHFAADQGRDVYAMPGSPDKPEYEGTNKLISEGAQPLLSPKELLSVYEGKYKGINTDNVMSLGGKELKTLYDKAVGEYEVVPRRKPSVKKDTKKTVEKVKKTVHNTVAKREVLLTGDCKTVYDLFGDGDMYVDNIVQMSNLGTSAVLKALTTLELKGLVTPLPGARYRLK